MYNAWLFDTGKEKIALFHSWYYEKEFPSDKKIYSNISDLCVISIGISFLAVVTIIGITESVLSYITYALEFVVGIVLLIYAEVKYNR